MATINSAGTGNWNTGATWAGGSVPNVATTDVAILAGHTVTLDVNITPAAARTITIQNGGVVTISAGVNLILSNACTVDIQPGGTLSLPVGGIVQLSAGTIIQGGTLVMGGGMLMWNSVGVIKLYHRPSGVQTGAGVTLLDVSNIYGTTGGGGGGGSGMGFGILM